ncbi:hypothetical protein [Halosimplex sp. TS25]|uniref:hypothetical protein n=1 Tax=Halosimplex rarum TaxID=3396619 RepID=UPI0039E94185
MREGTSKQLALVALGVVLLAAAAVVPVDAVRWHDTSADQPHFAAGNATELRGEGYDIVAYENLSDRGKELYVATLESGGEYRVPAGEGAEDFAYPSRADVIEDANHSGLDAQAAMHVAIERPNGSADIPAADEPVDDARYDVVLTKTAPPPLLTGARAPQVLLALAGLAALGYGGSRLATL